MNNNKNKDLALSIAKNIFLPSSFDDPFIRYRLGYLIVGIVLFFFGGWGTIFTYLGYLFLIMFFVSIPIHYYERSRMFKLMQNITMPRA